MAGDGIYGLWLNQKGRVVADGFVIHVGEADFLACSYHAPAEVVRERLDGYLIADEVELADDTAAWAGITFFTDAMIEDVRATLPGGLVFRGRRVAASHFEWIAPRKVVAEFSAQLDPAQRLTEAEVERRRIIDGVPAVPQDIGPGELPNEGGLEHVAISYTKGCYLGQEVMARLHAMGQVRRRLVSVRGAAAVPTLPAPLFAGDRQAGEMRSAVVEGDGFAGLALVTLLNLPTDRKLSLTAGGSAEVSVTLPA